jgi:hypothetical protein
MCNWFSNAKTGEPAFQNFKSDPEFIKIFKEIDSKYQTEHERVKKWLESNNIL